MFKPSRASRAFEDVVAQIQEAVLTGRLAVGERLPAERQLQTVFGVSRGTLREALRALEQKGLLTIKTGVRGGPVVRQVGTRLVSESLDLLLRYQKISLRELAEFREAVEGVVAAAAAARAQREDLRELREILRAAEALLEAEPFNWERFVAEDNRFHFALARIADNRVFESVVQTIYENITPYFTRHLPRERRLMRQNAEELRGILEAVIARDPKQARRRVQAHVRHFNSLVEKGEAKRGGA